ncbi:endonuclease/exonuclease/phosphatase family protein [Chitinophaga sp.]|uniref:endonuclease/exonuclease/phosphatase family protein n=1 Tax=Chitinophaga sp. TaxID=1869181 RepID=UPI0031D508B1
MKLVRVIIRRLLLWSNVFLAITLLFSFFLTFTDPAVFWPAGFAGLPFIFLWPACFLFIPLWIFYRRRYWLIPVPALLLTLPGSGASWGFHATGGARAPGPASFTVMTFNCSSMGLLHYKTDPVKCQRIYEELKKASPDVLCMQEFFTNSGTRAPNHLDSIRLKLKYDHYYFVNHYTNWQNWHYGTIIFSRFPLIDTTAIDLQNISPEEKMIAARLLVHGDTVRLLSAHLASQNLQKNEYTVVTAPKGQARGVMKKMKAAFGLRSMQAQLIRREIAATQEPLIVLGDFNDVPVSYTYKTIRSGLQDAFLAQGSGLGRTFSAVAPHLRIDYILAGQQFTVEDFFIYRRKGFEHFPVMARLSLKR